MMINVKMSVAQ